MKRQSNKIFLTLTGIFISIIFGAIYLYHPLFVEYLDNKIYDILLIHSPHPSPSNATIIVDIDEKSLQQYGQWPWPRYLVALLLEKIRQRGARAIGLDILFAEPDRTSPRRIKRELKRFLGIDVAFEGLPPQLQDNDQIFAQVLSHPAYVLGYFFTFAKGPSRSPPTTSIPSPTINIVRKAGAPSEKKFLLRATGALLPLKILLSHVHACGFFNTQPESDGILRATPFVIWYKGRVYPALSLATLLQALGGKSAVLKVTSNGIESIKIGNTVVPLDRGGRFWIDFLGPARTLPYISAADILEDKVKVRDIRDKIVFVGTSATGLMDLKSTPVDPVYPGVEAHATIVENILRGNFITRPDWAPGAEFLAILISGILLTLLIINLRPLWVSILTLSAITGMWIGAQHLFNGAHIFLSPSLPILNMGVIFSFLSLEKFFWAEREKRFYRSAFSQYVAPQIVEEIIKSPDKLRLEGEEKEVSILFSDIRGFTSISERLSPTQISQLLQEYFSPMTEVITTHKGTLDKFIGDAIMAFWNAPLDVSHHQLLAVKAALGMTTTLFKLNRHFKDKFNVDLKIGIGIHCGMVHVGNMGSKELFDYTIIGDNVNLASRLEGLTKFYGRDLIISETIAPYCRKDFFLQELDMVKVKGKERPVTIYTIHTLERAKRFKEEFELYNHALLLYKKRRFKEAQEAFQELRNKFIDLKLYELYEKRCIEMIKHPPPDDWDGVFTHTKK